jgi:hypothetical protein
MPRTQGTYNMDTPFGDGSIALMAGADIVQIAGAGTSALTRIAAGEYSLRTATASVAYTFFGGVTGLVFRTGVQDDLQEQFGSTRAGGSNLLPVGSPLTLATASTVAGTAVSVTVESTVGFFAGQYVTVDTVASGVQEFAQISSITSATVMVLNKLVNSHTALFPVAENLFTTPAGVTGRPPYTGISELTPVSSVRPKGIGIRGLTVIYAVNTTAITVPTVGLFATQFANNVAPVVTTLITQGTNGLQTAAQANPYAIPVPVPFAQQGFIITPNTLISVEFDFTSGGTGTVDVLGIVLTCNWNYN